MDTNDEDVLVWSSSKYFMTNLQSLKYQINYSN